jgi:hypothetical protein
VTGRPATVRDHDDDTSCGSVLFDDGTSTTYDAAALADGGALMLRTGQRVVVDLDSGGRVTRVAIPGFPLA